MKFPKVKCPFEVWKINTMIVWTDELLKDVMSNSVQVKTKETGDTKTQNKLFP